MVSAKAQWNKDKRAAQKAKKIDKNRKRIHAYHENKENIAIPTQV